MPRNFELNIQGLENKFKQINSELNSLEGQCLLLNEQIQSSEQKLRELSHKREVYQKSIELLTYVMEFTKQNIKKGFENLVTYALRYVFNEDYKFILDFDRRGNLQEIDFKILSPKGIKLEDLLSSSGGGILDVVSLALRIISLELKKPKDNSFIALDEPIKHVSSEFRPAIGKLFKELSQKLNRQFIIVTHFEELKEYANKEMKIE